LRKITIIGGGLAGLISSIQLTRAGIPCTVVEKKSYPLHRVCGEYISNEASPFLRASGLYPEGLILPQIKFLELSAVNGRSCRLPLDLGGFGISRYAFDHSLYRIASKEGVQFELNTEASAIHYRDDQFQIETTSGPLVSDIVIGAFGKRSRIDVQQKRRFISLKSPYVGVKYHIRCKQPEDLISLHNFPGGYCGVCNVEAGITNLCYLTHRDNVRRHGSLEDVERNILYQNPFLKDIFLGSTFVFRKPEVINEISFETKSPVDNHILMAGDSAGMITPVCGNGMAMAIHAAKILSEYVIEFCAGKINRGQLEHRYAQGWNQQFKTRLWFGRNVQRLFGNAQVSNAAINLGRFSKPVAKTIIGMTHGQSF
jgi:flavin-dependent dehydrogenase